MAAFWAEMGVAYLEINKRPCLHEIFLALSCVAMLHTRKIKK
jgi:hypothetical protein